MSVFNIEQQIEPFVLLCCHAENLYLKSDEVSVVSYGTHKHCTVLHSQLRINCNLLAAELLPWIPQVPRKTENRTSGSARHPIVLRIQSEASIPILGYSVIGQILTGDLHFYNTMFWHHFNYLREAATYGSATAGWRLKRKSVSQELCN